MLFIDQMDLNNLDPNYMHGWDLLLWIGVILVFAIASINYFIESHKAKEMASQQWLFFGYGFFALFQSVVQFFFTIEYYYRISAIWLNQLDAIANFIAQISMVPIIVVFEKYVLQKTKRILTIVTLVLIAISLFTIIFPSVEPILLNYERIPYFFLIAVVALIFFYLIKKSIGRSEFGQ